MTGAEIGMLVAAYALIGAAVGGYIVARAAAAGENVDEGWETVLGSVFIWPIALATIIGIRIAELGRRSHDVP